MIILIDSGKAFDKIYPFMIKKPNKSDIEGAYLNLIKGHITNPQPTSYSMAKG